MTMHHDQDPALLQPVTIEPFTVAGPDGRVSALVVPPYLWKGVVVGGLGILGMAEGVAAHEVPTDTPEGMLQSVVVEQNSSPWEAMEIAGYTPEEITLDMEIKGIPFELDKQPIVQPGHVWPISPEVQALKNSRLGIPLAEDSAIPVTLTEKNDNFWNELHERGIDEYTEELLALNGISLGQADEQPIGATILVPIEYFDEIAAEQTISEVVPEVGATTEIVVATPVAEPVAEVTAIDTPVEQTLVEPTNVVVPEEVAVEQAAPIEVLPAESAAVIEQVAPPKNVYVIGDSITQGLFQLGGLGQALEQQGITTAVNAVESRSLHEALRDISIEELAGYDAVVIALGTNAKESNEAFRSELSGLVSSLSELPQPPRLVVTNLFEQGQEDIIPEAERNQIIQDVVAFSQGGPVEVGLLDWNTIGTQHPELFEGGDGIHPIQYDQAAAIVASQLFEVEPVAVASEAVVPSTEVVAQTLPSPENSVAPTTYAEYLASLEQPQMPAELALLQEQANAIPNYNQRIAAKIEFLKQYSEWLSSVVTLDSKGYELFLQSGINKDHIHAFSNERPVINGETIATECVVKHWMAGMPNTVQDFAAQMKHNVQFAIWGDGTVYQMVPELNSKAFHAAGVNNRCYGTEMWGEVGTDFSYAEIVSSLYLDIYMSQALGFPLIRDVAAIEQSPLDIYDDFLPSDEIVRATTYLTHKSADRVIANDPVGKIDIPEYMANWMFIRMQDFRFEADVIWHLHNNPELNNIVVPEVPAPELPAPAPEIPTAVPEVPAELPTVPAPEPIQTTENPTPEQIQQAWAMSPEEYVNTYNNGESISVQLRGGDVMTAPADIQKYVDIVWRLEHGRSYETVVEALTVSLAESGWNNAAVNKNTGDRCWFQINKINRELVANLGYDYDNLQNDPLACTRVAFALFELSEGFKYSARYVDKWEEFYGLKLPPDLLDLVNSGYISHGWQWWLMSARKTGVL